MDGISDLFLLIVLRISTGFSGQRDPAGLGMDEVLVVTLSAAIHKSSALQVGDEHPARDERRMVPKGGLEPQTTRQPI